MVPREEVGGGMGEIKGIKSTLITMRRGMYSAEECTELLNHYVVYLQLPGHCMVIILQLKK